MTFKKGCNMVVFCLKEKKIEMAVFCFLNVLLSSNNSIRKLDDIYERFLICKLTFRPFNLFVCQIRVHLALKCVVFFKSSDHFLAGKMLHYNGCIGFLQVF